MAATPQQSFQISDAPKRVTTDRGSEVGRLEESVRTWAREVTLRLQKLAAAVESSTPTAQATPSAASVRVSSPQPTPQVILPATGSLQATGDLSPESLVKTMEGMSWEDLGTVRYIDVSVGGTPVRVMVTA